MPTSPPITPDRLATAVEKLLHTDRPRFRRLWAYFRNPIRPLDGAGDDKPYRQAQEWGLPARITGFRAGGDGEVAQRVQDVARKEVVIENDIAWRVETMVEYLFGKPLVLLSAAPDPVRREMLSDLLRQILAANGGMLFLQQLALLGSVHGFVDVLVKLDAAKLREMRVDGAREAASGKTPDNLNGCGDTQALGRPPVDSCNDPSADAALASARARDEDAPPAAQDPAPGGADVPSPSAAATEKPDDPALDLPSRANQASNLSEALAGFAGVVRFEMIEPARALPFLAQDDYRVVETYGQVFEMTTPVSSSSTPVAVRPDPVAEGKPSSQPAWIDRMYRAAIHKLRPPLIRFNKAGSLHTVQVIELLSAKAWHRYEDGQLIASGVNSLGELPLVHIQNLAVPFKYGGASDVEPLIPLQDELNTRLSDRAHRITMQSFKMYLGRCIDNFTEMPVAPGRMWATDNPNASVIEFGGDSANPSEESHIAEIREALDKTSGVSPVAAGGVKNKLGNLTSAAALRVTMQSLLSKTEKKRITFGVAIGRMCELALAWLDAAGVFPTAPDERRVEIHWANPLPVSDTESLDQAKAKLQLGIPREVVARELGY